MYCEKKEEDHKQEYIRKSKHAAGLTSLIYTENARGFAVFKGLKWTIRIEEKGRRFCISVRHRTTKSEDLLLSED